jgi:ketosteroid isomerase-like protein
MEQEIVEQEERLADAKRALDVGAIDRVYADDLLLTGVMGEPTCSKTAVIDEVRRGIAERDSARAGDQPLVMSAVNEDMKVVRHGDTAIANYRFVVKITTPTADVVRRYRATNVWKQKDGRWQIIAAHMSFVLDPTQAAMLSGEGR